MGLKRNVKTIVRQLQGRTFRAKSPFVSSALEKRGDDMESAENSPGGESPPPQTTSVWILRKVNHTRRISDNAEELSRFFVQSGLVKFILFLFWTFCI